MLESVFNKVLGLRPAALLKRDSNTGLFYKICEIFQNTFYYSKPPVSASGDFLSIIVSFSCSIEQQLQRKTL